MLYRQARALNMQDIRAADVVNPINSLFKYLTLSDSAMSTTVPTSVLDLTKGQTDEYPRENRLGQRLVPGTNSDAK